MKTSLQTVSESSPVPSMGRGARGDSIRLSLPGRMKGKYRLKVIVQQRIRLGINATPKV